MTQINSPSFGIDKKGLIKVAKGTGIAAAGAALVYLAEAIPGIDFGVYTPVIVGLASVLINFARKWILNYQ